MMSRSFYGSKSSSSNRLAPLALVNARIQETSQYIAERRNSHLYSPGDRLQDKDGVSLGLSDIEDEFEEDGETQRDKSPFCTPTSMMGSMSGLNLAYTTPSRFDFLEPTQNRSRHRQEPFVIGRGGHGGHDGGGINFCAMLQEQQTGNASTDTRKPRGSTRQTFTIRSKTG